MKARLSGRASAGGLLLAAVSLLAGCSLPPNLVVLRVDDDGHLGRAVVSHDGATAELTRRNMAAANNGAGDGAQEVTSLSDDQVISAFAGAMAAQPPTPKSMIVFFGVGATTILPDSAATLAEAIKAGQLGMFPDISVVGYADASGTLAQNLMLSRKRAEGVRDALAAAGIKASGIQISAQGPHQSGRRASPAEGQRAVEITIR